MFRCLCILLFSAFLFGQDLRLQVLCTTDTHGKIVAEDAFTLQPQPQGWAKLATLIRELKSKNPNSILVDCGDTLQGEPSSYVRARLKPELPDPAMAIMNALGFHAMTVGNHDFDFGMDILRGAEQQAQFPWISANTVLASTGKPAFTPYVKIEMGGASVAIVGFTTPAVPTFEEPGNIEGLKFLDIVETARTLIPRLREREKVDLVIVALHSGLGRSPGAPLDENEALVLADQVPGIDLILTGHTHQAITTKRNGVPILQAQSQGRVLGVAELLLRRTKGKWRLESSDARLVRPDASTAADPQVLELTAALRRLTDTYLDTSATVLATDLDGRWSHMEDSAIVQLLHKVQLQATKADISAIASPGAKIFIPKGATSVRQFYALMPYENHAARIRVTGQQLRLYLEHAARFFNFSHEPDLFNREIQGFDYDMLDGCTYVLDLSKPVGSRVAELKVQGVPVKPDQTFTLAITTYRLYGGGGYMKAIGFTGQAELVTPQTLRNLLLEYVLARPSLSVPVDNNWHTIPALDRERVLVQQPN